MSDHQVTVMTVFEAEDVGQVGLNAALRTFGLGKGAPEAVSVHWSFDPGGADPALWVRLRVRVGDLDALLRFWGFSGPLGRTRQLGNYTGSHLQWWAPDGETPTASGRVELAEPRRHARHVLVGSPAGDLAEVYVFVVGL